MGIFSTDFVDTLKYFGNVPSSALYQNFGNYVRTVLGQPSAAYAAAREITSGFGSREIRSFRDSRGGELNPALRGNIGATTTLLDRAAGTDGKRRGIMYPAVYDSLGAPPVNDPTFLVFQFNPELMTEDIITNYESDSQTGVGFSRHTWISNGDRKLTFTLEFDASLGALTSELGPYFRECYGMAGNFPIIGGPKTPFDINGDTRNIIPQISKGATPFDSLLEEYRNSPLGKVGVNLMVNRLKSYMVPTPVKFEEGSLRPKRDLTAQVFDSNGSRRLQPQFTPPPLIRFKYGPTIDFLGHIASAPAQYTRWSEGINGLIPVGCDVPVTFIIHETGIAGTDRTGFVNAADIPPILRK